MSNQLIHPSPKKDIIHNVEKNFVDIRALVSLKYFYETSDGRIHLRKDLSPPIIDFHTHIGWRLLDKVPQILGDTVFPYMGCPISLNRYSAYDFDRKFKTKARNKTIRAILARGKNRSNSASHLLLEMEALNISRSVVLSVDILGKANSKLVLETSKRRPGSFIPFISLRPKQKNPEKLFLNYLNQGARGIKIHPAIQRVRPNSNFVCSLSELAEKHRLPILFHCGYSPLTPKSMKKFTNMDDFRDIIKKYHGVTYILGHSGINEWEYAMKIAIENENVYLELSGQPPDVIKKFIKLLGSDRLLFGSDWPYYPVVLPLTKVLIATEGNEKARNEILFANASKLL